MMQSGSIVWIIQFILGFVASSHTHQTNSGVRGLPDKWAVFSFWLTENKNKPRRLFDEASSIGFESVLSLALAAFHWLAVHSPGKQEMCLYRRVSERKVKIENYSKARESCHEEDETVRILRKRFETKKRRRV